MRQSHATPILALILIGTLLAAGCMAPPEPAAPMEISSIPRATVLVTTGIPVQTAMPGICLPVNNTSYISIDPVPVHHIGDTITFRGTTNLEPGEPVNVRISGYMPMCTKCRGDFADSVAGCCGEFNRTVFVSEGECGNNLWALDVNTSDHGFHPDEDYWIGMYGRGSKVENSSFFTVSGIPRPNLTLNLPENDASGFAIRFSGRSNTGNSPDEKLLVAVSSDSGRGASFMIPVYVNGTGFFWNFSVNKSAILPYNFFTVNVTSATSPAIRIERTFMYNNEPMYFPYNPVSP